NRHRNAHDRDKKADFGDATNDPGSLPAPAGAHGQVPAIRHSGAVRQRGTVHVRSHQAVSVMSRRKMPQEFFGERFLETHMRPMLLAGFVLLAATSSPSPGATQSRPWSEGYFPNLPVVTQDGRTVRFYDDLIKGRMVIVSFIYTSCPDICPLTTARL